MQYQYALEADLSNKQQTAVMAEMKFKGRAKTPNTVPAMIKCIHQHCLIED
jgi:hypothetical protein